MENSIVKLFNGNNISFIRLGNGDIMVSATDMARPYGKRSNDFLRLEQTESFIKTLNTRYGDSRNADFQAVMIRQGGLGPQGTWLHQKLALKFAGWLSPEFELWMMDKIEELITTGKVELKEKTKTEKIYEGYKLLMEEVEEMKERNRLLEATVEEQAPKVQYVEKVLQSKSLFCTTQIAKELGMSAKTLNTRLKADRIQHKVNGQWVLYSDYQDKGYVGTKTHSYRDSTGNERTSIQTVWTEKGREMIHSMYNLAYRKVA